MTPRPTKDEISKILDYCPGSGLFTWIRPPGNHSRLDLTTAGSIGNGYVAIRIDGVRYRAHHLAWLITYGEWPAEEVDHRNGCPLDNRSENLRLATNPQNQANRARNKGKTVSNGVRVLPSGAFNARIKVKGVAINLGVFPTEDAAVSAYMQAAQQHYGEFARKA